MIKPCTCESVYQDKKYGAGKRVMNPLTKTEGGRCTICEKDHVQFVGKGKDKKK